MKATRLSRAFKLITRLLLLGVVAWSTGGENHAGPKSLKFKGKELWDKQTGLTVLPDQEDGDVVLSSIHHGYFLVLPYSESWLFTTSRQLPLEGQDDHYVVSIAVEPRHEGESEKDRLAPCWRVLKGLGQGLYAMPGFWSPTATRF
jgi:hypothetical protein